MSSNHTSAPPQLFLIATALAFMTLTSFVAPTTSTAAGPCDAYSYTAGSSFAQVFAFHDSSHTGCTAGVPSGAAISCDRVTTKGSFSNRLQAGWYSQFARTQDAVGGCSFMCTSGDCRVGNDGLPVELLQFGVE